MLRRDLQVLNGNPASSPPENLLYPGTVQNPDAHPEPQPVNHRSLKVGPSHPHFKH